MGHIRLSRDADLIVVSPASADLLAKMAAGLANDLASAVLLATDKPVLVAPAMNAHMWAHSATQRNLRTLEADGVLRVGPESGDLACGEEGVGRMAEPEQILAAIDRAIPGEQSLSGLRALVTSGPTYEAIDPMRFIGNRSSGKQGHAIAAACARLGAEVTLVSGPTNQPDPLGVFVVRIESAAEMRAACEEALPVDVAVCAAAVSDWRVAEPRNQKIKKNGAPPSLVLVENPDVLAELGAAGNRRPSLVIGFAAETEKVVENAIAKRARKGCDWIVANDISPQTGTLGGDCNAVHLISAEGVEHWPAMSKTAVAERLVARVAEHLAAARDE